MFSNTVDKVLSKFSKIVDELEEVAIQEAKKADEYADIAEKNLNLSTLSRLEAEKAERIADRIAGLIE